MKKASCDVLIIGAGAAGVVSALYASKIGLKTILVERESKIGKHTTTKVDVTESTDIEKIFDELELPYLAKNNSSVWYSRNHQFRLQSKVADFVIKRGPEKDSFENIIVNKAKRNGCEVFLNSTLDFTSISETSCVVHRKNEEIEITFKYLIIASGFNSKFFEKHGIKEKNQILICGYGKILKDLDMPLNTTFVFFDSKIVPGGYFYMVKTKSIESACIVFPKPTPRMKMSAAYNEFIKKNKNLKKIIKNGKTISDFVGASKAADITKRSFGNKILVGDAARLLDPLFGYGVRQAILSGYNAISSIIKYSKNKEVSLQYDKSLESLLMEFKYARNGRKILEVMTNKDIDNVFEFLEEISKSKSIDSLIENPILAGYLALKYSVVKPKFRSTIKKSIKRLIF